MPIDVYCESCQKKLRVPDTVAGKRIKCPKCQSVLSVPAASAAAAPTTPTVTPSAPAAAVKAASASKSGAIPTTKPAAPVTPKSSVKLPAQPVEQWFVQTEDGEQYGPVTRTELDQWHTEGRLTTDTQILREGSEQWQWASDLYPDLMPQENAAAPAAEAAPEATKSEIPDFGAIAAAASSEPAAESGAAPFDIAASSTPSTTTATTKPARGKKGGKKKSREPKAGSPHIDYIAYTLYAGAGLIGLFCLLMLTMGLSGAAAVGSSGVDNAGAAAGIVGTIVTVMCVFFLLIAAGYAAVGYGLQQRASWSRITAIVLGILSLPNVPLGTALGIWIWIVLTDEENKKAFA